MKSLHETCGISHPIHRVATELGDGDEEVRWTVKCPDSQHVVDLKTCEACPHLERIERGADSPERLVCEPQVESPPNPPGEAFKPLLTPLLEHARVDELMTRDVYCVGEEMLAEELAALFATRKVSGVPVVDENERLVGVVSRADLLRAPEDEENPPVLHPERAGATAARLMNPAPVVVPEGATIPYAAAVMATARVHRVLVVSPQGSVVGILTALDVVHWVARKAGYAV